MESRQLLLLGMMDRPVAEVLRAFPPLASVFLRNHVACPGCFLASFCSLRDVFSTYELDGEAVLEQIAEQTRPVGQIHGLN